MQLLDENTIEPGAKAPFLSVLVRRFWLITVLVALAAAIVVGGGVYWLMNNRLVSERQSWQQEIFDLESQITKLQTESTNATGLGTTNWKIYRNEKDRIAIKYPNDWKEENGTLYSPEMYNMREGGPYSLLIHAQPDFKDIDQWLNNQSRCVKELTRFTINGSDAIRYIDICAFSNPKVTVTLVNNTIIEGISYSVSDESNIIKQILSTLRFLDTKNVSIDDWKAYTNEPIGLAFKYPSALGDVVEEMADAYFTHELTFSGYNDSDRIVIYTFTDNSVKKWEEGINVNILRTIDFPLNIKKLLKEKSIGYDCTVNFGPSLDKTFNESCIIVNAANKKALKIIMDGPHQSEVSQLRYIFYENDSWYDIQRNFWLDSVKHPERKSYKDINATLRRDGEGSSIKDDMRLFEQIISTFKFFEGKPVSTAGWKKYSMNGYQFNYPSAWKAKEVEGRVEFIADVNNKWVALLQCPIVATGYEAWNFDDKERLYTKGGKKYGATLWLGTPIDDMGIGDTVAVLFMHRGSFEEFREGGDKIVGSCQLFSKPAEGLFDIYRKIYESLY